MTTWITGDDLADHLHLSAVEASDKSDSLALAASAVSEWMSTRFPTYEETGDVPDVGVLAALMYGARFYKRSSAVTGFEAFNETSVRRVTGLDGDAETLLASITSYTGFA